MSEEQDDAQKTEEPTPKRLEDSRKKGQVALSREVNNWLMLLTGTVLLGALSPPVLARLREHMRSYIEHSAAVPQTQDGGDFSVVLGEVLTGSFWSIIGILALPLLILMVAAFLGPFLQIGPLFAPEAIKPSVSKISPLQGFKRLFSKRALMEFLKGVLKISVVGLVGFVILYPFYGQAEHFVGLPVSLMLAELLSLVIRLMLGILVALIVIAVIDVAFQKAEHQRKIRMTKQEVKDEYKQTEGDPHVKARLRQLRNERARQRMMQAVPSADVVITNPTHFAVALKYDPDEMDAPVCVAKGIDEVALRIREMAKENDIVVYENPPLARVLFDTVEIDDQVPPEHFQAVAEIISYVFKLKGKI